VLPRFLVGAVFVLMVVAAADAVRGSGSNRVLGKPEPRLDVALPGGPANEGQGFVASADGRLTSTRVVRHGKEVLSSDQVDEAFSVPFEEGGTFDIADVAVAPDGTLAVAVYEFPAAGSVQSGVELWKGDRLLAAFEVAPGSFAGGIGFTDDGFVAAFEHDGRGATVYDRSGRRRGYVPLR
jgi:hypothetical protein